MTTRRAANGKAYKGKCQDPTPENVVIVESGTDKITASYSNELAQELQAAHGLNVGDELDCFLTTELLANNEVLDVETTPSIELVTIQKSKRKRKKKKT